jgi:hypothetical protein
MTMQGTPICSEAPNQPEIQHWVAHLPGRIPGGLSGAGLLAAVPITLIIFDVLGPGLGHLTDSPYVLRRALLEDLRLEVPGAVQVPPAFTGGAAALLAATQTRAWRDRAHAAVHMSIPRLYSLEFAGTVGNGLSMAELTALLESMKWAVSPFTGPVPGARSPGRPGEPSLLPPLKWPIWSVRRPGGFATWYGAACGPVSSCHLTAAATRSSFGGVRCAQVSMSTRLARGQHVVRSSPMMAIVWCASVRVISSSARPQCRASMKWWII